MLTMTGLTKSYRTDTVETTALDCVDLDIAEGEVVLRILLKQSRFTVESLCLAEAQARRLEALVRQ